MFAARLFKVCLSFLSFGTGFYMIGTSVIKGMTVFIQCKSFFLCIYTADERNILLKLFGCNLNKTGNVIIKNKFIRTVRIGTKNNQSKWNTIEVMCLDTETGHCRFLAVSFSNISMVISSEISSNYRRKKE